MGLKSLKKEPSLAEKAYTAIKEAIISNELAPGTALAEETLAAHLGISRTPIRTALLVVVVGGTVLGATLLHGLFGIEPFTVPMAVLLAVCAVAASALFHWLYGVFGRWHEARLARWA